MKESESCSVVSDSLQPHRLYSPWNSPGENSGMGSLSLLQGIFPNQGSNPGLLHCRWILYQMSYLLERSAALFMETGERKTHAPQPTPHPTPIPTTAPPPLPLIRVLPKATWKAALPSQQQATDWCHLLEGRFTQKPVSL